MTFTGGAAFISSQTRRKTDCVVLNINMPGMNGFDPQSQLAADPATYGISIVLITGNYSSEIEQSRQGGQTESALIRKPFETQALLDAIRSAVASKHE